MGAAVIGISAHSEKPEAQAAIADVAQAVRGAGGVPLLSADNEPVSGVDAAPDRELYAKSDVIIVMGGDGAFLRAQKKAAPLGKPILCAHFGRLGFLSEADRGELPSAAARLVRGEYSVETRMMITGQTSRGSGTALNDIVLSRGLGQGILRYRIDVNGSLMDRYGADGMVVSTPTGATAYALSAGGPIVGEGLDCLVLCPLYPHTLRARATVLSPGSQVALVIESGGEGSVQIDGQPADKLLPGEEITICRAPYDARFVRLHARDFYAHLRSKLVEWSS